MKRVFLHDHRPDSFPGDGAVGVAVVVVRPFAFSTLFKIFSVCTESARSHPPTRASCLPFLTRTRAAPPFPLSHEPMGASIEVFYGTLFFCGEQFLHITNGEQFKTTAVNRLKFPVAVGQCIN